MTVHERFGAWLASVGWNTGEAARRLGCDRSHVHRMRSGQRGPGRRMANRIEELSAEWCAGPVRSTEWDQRDGKCAH